MSVPPRVVEVQTQDPDIDKPRDEDAAALAALGVEQKMKRTFNIWSLTIMCFSTSVTWEAICSTLAQALTAGGSSSLVWGFVVSATGALFISLCLAEYASMIPTAGGQYHYVAHMSPPKFRRIFSWYAGWVTLWSWILAATAGIFASCMQIQSYIILFTPGYVYERWHTSLIVMCMTTWFALQSIFAVKSIHYGTFLAIVAHCAGYIATVVYLLVKVNPKNTAKFVFTDTTSLTGWDNSGVTWSIGLLTAALGFVGWDSSTHMAEEMKHASRDLPRTMWGTVAISGLATFPWVIALMFCITDVAGLLEGPVGQLSPLVQMLYNVSGGSQPATVGMTIFFLIVSFAVGGPSCVSASSRIIMSLALNSIILVWAVICGLACIYIGNATAYYGISSGTTVVCIVSYALPILVNLFWGFEHVAVPRGSFTLGRWSKVFGTVAVAWCAYLTIFLCFPVYLPVTAVNMNYSCIVLGASFFVPTIIWLAYGRRNYVGVLIHVHSSEEVSVQDAGFAMDPKMKL